MNGGCCGSCAAGGTCTARPITIENVVQVGAISASTVAGIPVVASVGGVAGAYAGWWLGKKLLGNGLLAKVAGAAVIGWLGYKELPAATDAAGI